MDDNQQAYLNMLLKVQDNLEDHALDYADHIRIAPTKVLLDDIILKIIEAAGFATEDITGVGDEKRAERKALETIMYKVAKGVYSYADDNDYLKLRKKVKYTDSDLQGMQDTEIHFKALHLKGYITPVIAAALVGYRVTAQDITDLGDETTAYYNIIPETKDAIEDRAVAGKKIDRLQDESRILLVKLDNYVDSYKTDATTISLWEEYQLCRAIDDPTGGGGGGVVSQVVFSGTVPPMNKEVKGPVVYNPSTPANLQNNSNVTLAFQLQQNGLAVGMAINVPPMSNQLTTLGDMAPNGNEILISNSDMAQSAAYVVTLG